ncbi:probable JmjC domain-containing histone demethylation protein 2C [Pomacea canaliculata]|uniref:probable JmjC domain-containing histone demethylation protein 2C n=1 Tax=Pomacea canaliculata TaxID=400727 RepID=UPI000D729813|nr:probable JmjC domain-containing histone demethylation protein 2C [Pomacea canaliculata]
MAYKCREEIVGKRFLSVRSPTKLKVSKISEWEWRSGVVRAVSSRDTASVDFTALVEYEDVEWQKREWTRVHETYQEFLVEHTLVWTCRPVTDKESTPSPPLPALCFKPIVDKLGLGTTKKRVVQFLVDHDLAFVEEEDIRFYQEGDENRYDAGSPEAQKAVKAWVDYQDGQKILLTTPTVLVGLPSEGVPCRGHHAVVHSRHPVLQPHHQESDNYRRYGVGGAQ